MAGMGDLEKLRGPRLYAGVIRTRGDGIDIYDVRKPTGIFRLIRRIGSSVFERDSVMASKPGQDVGSTTDEEWNSAIREADNFETARES